MFNQFVHMHGLGRGVRTRRVRNNRELRPLVNVKHFDYAYQSWLGIWLMFGELRGLPGAPASQRGSTTDPPCSAR